MGPVTTGTPLKLALVIPGPLDRRSGGYSYDVDLAQALQSSGHTVSVWSLEGRASDLPPPGQEAVEMAIFDALAHPLVVERLERSATSFRKVALVHHLAWKDDPPGHPDAPQKKALESRFLATMDAFVFNSEETGRSVAALMGPDFFRPAACFRPPLGVKPSSAGPLPPAYGEPFQLLFLANVTPRKNLLGLLQALLELTSQYPSLPWRLRVVGNQQVDVEYVASCREFAQRSGLAGLVRWDPWKDPAQLAKVWASTHLLVVPSFHEGWGMVYAEAMARGIPSLASNTGGGAEAVGTTGLLVDVTSPPEMAREMARWMTDPALQRELELRCRQRAAWLGGPGSGFAGLPEFLQDVVSLGVSADATYSVDWNAWLECKAGVDERSLHPRVQTAAFQGLIPRQVLELGGGTGTMARRLLKQGLIAPQTLYTLVDSSPLAVAEAQRQCGPLFAGDNFVAQQGDLYRYLDQARGNHPPELVVAHALLDLLDPGRASVALEKLGARHYWLTHLFDGLTEFLPVLDAALDDRVVAAYHATMDDRHRLGGEGSSRSGKAWLEALPAAGLTVLEAASSDWVVVPRAGRYLEHEQEFLAHLLQFFRASLTQEALSGLSLLNQEALSWWLHARTSQLRRGQLGVVVHQLDLLAGRR